MDYKDVKFWHGLVKGPIYKLTFGLQLILLQQ
jgi:hypothetical protein